MIFLLLITVLLLAALFLLLFLLGKSRFDLLLRLAERLLPPSQRFLQNCLVE